jgi:hypothetical protein
MRLLGKILLLCFTLYSLPISAQKHQWAKSLDAFTDSSFGSFFGGGSFNNWHNRYIDFNLPAFSKAEALDLDSANNVYVAGFYRDSMQIDSFTAGNEGNVHLSKFDSRGNHKWTQTILSRKQPVNISDVLVVHANRIIIYGHICYDRLGFTLKLSPNDSIYDNGIDTRKAHYVSFVIEYDSLGNLLYYQKIFEVKYSDLFLLNNNANLLVKDKDNNLIFSALCHRNIPSSTAYTRNGTHSYNNPNLAYSQVLLKYSTDYDSLLWMKNPYDGVITNTLGYSLHIRIKTDTMGNLYLFPSVLEGDQVFLNGITQTVPKYRTLTKNLVKSLLVILNPDGDLLYADFFSSLAGPNDFSSDMIEDIVAIDTNRFYIIGYMSDTLRVAN